MTINWKCDKCSAENQYEPRSSKSDDGQILMEMKTFAHAKPKEYVVTCKKCGNQRKVVVYDL